MKLNTNLKEKHHSRNMVKKLRTIIILKTERPSPLIIANYIHLLAKLN